MIPFEGPKASPILDSITDTMDKADREEDSMSRRYLLDHPNHITGNQQARCTPTILPLRLLHQQEEVAVASTELQTIDQL